MKFYQGIEIDPFKSELFSFALIVGEKIRGDIAKEHKDEQYAYELRRELSSSVKKISKNSGLFINLCKRPL